MYRARRLIAVRIEGLLLGRRRIFMKLDLLIVLVDQRGVISLSSGHIKVKNVTMVGRKQLGLYVLQFFRRSLR